MRALLTVVVSTCVLLTACGGSDDTQTGSETRATSQEATPSPNETPNVAETPVRVQEVEGHVHPHRGGDRDARGWSSRRQVARV